MIVIIVIIGGRVIWGGLIIQLSGEVWVEYAFEQFRGYRDESSVGQGVRVIHLDLGYAVDADVTRYRCDAAVAVWSEGVSGGVRGM
jgi:hypothetical protein